MRCVLKLGNTKSGKREREREREIESNDTIFIILPREVLKVFIAVANIAGLSG